MGVSGKRVAGLGGLGEWVSGGRLTAGGGEVAGRACPAPTGGGRVRGCGMVSGHLCRGRRPRRAAEGSRPLPTVWGETGWQSSNGWLWKACGPGMPGPYGVAEGCAGAGGGGSRRGNGTSLRLLPHTQ